MKEPKDLRLANKIKSEYKDIPMFRDAANKFMRELAAKAINDENEIEREVLSSRRATDFTAGYTDEAGNWWRQTCRGSSQ